MPGSAWILVSSGIAVCWLQGIADILAFSGPVLIKLLVDWLLDSHTPPAAHIGLSLAVLQAGEDGVGEPWWRLLIPWTRRVLEV